MTRVLVIGLTIVMCACLLVGCNSQKPVAAVAQGPDLEGYFHSDQARVLVAIDRGKFKRLSDKDLLDPGDLRVLRVEQLLNTISDRTHESVSDIALATCGAADILKTQYNRDITRQQLLEDICSAYARNELGVFRNKRFKEFVRTWAVAKYT